ncbi:DUF4397 domain-containing protein [Pedobacter sp. SYP-B3415]|uniref:DUF4397 domain-containing protein n=1 Tax=Pedobacter sp. SYP-B3415 TaxID=2496641 RepID=UPI001F10CFEC
MLTARYPYPGGGYNTLGDSRADYLRATPGKQEVSISIPKRGTLTDSVVLYKTEITTEPGKAYTLHLTDTAANTKSFLTQDDHSIPDSGFVRFRFVNLMPNVPAVDLYYGGVLVVGNISYLSASDYFLRPILTTAAVAWTIRPTGSAPTSTALATYTSANTFLNRRSYTVFATGYSGRTDAVRRPYVSFFLIK